MGLTRLVIAANQVHESHQTLRGVGSDDPVHWATFEAQLEALGRALEDLNCHQGLCPTVAMMQTRNMLLEDIANQCLELIEVEGGPTRAKEVLQDVVEGRPLRHGGRLR